MAGKFPTCDLRQTMQNAPMNRRSFLLKSAAAFFGASITQQLSAQGVGAAYINQLGLQLYTLRNPLKEGVLQTLQVVAAAGYKQVEPYGFPNADELISVSKDLGLKVNSTHFASDSAVDPKNGSFDEFKKVVEKAASQGLSHLVVPSLKGELRKTADDYKKVAGNLNKAGEIASASGITLSYHNHAFEFETLEGGKTGFDVFASELSTAKFELDLFWIAVAGLDPVAWLEKLSGRVSQVHLKDIKKDLETPMFKGLPKDAFKEVGNGKLDWIKILAACEKAGVQHAHVEQDQSDDALASVKQSAKYLKSL